MLLGLRARRIVFKHDVGGFVRIFLGVLPAAHGRAHETHHFVDERGIAQLVLHHVEAVLQRRDSLILVLEDDQIVGREPGVDHLPILVVGHRGNAVRLPLKEGRDVEALLEHRHSVVAAVRRNPELAHPAEERIFVSEEPDAECAASEILRGCDPGVLQASEHHPGRLERLRNIDDGKTAFPARERGRHPVDDHIRASAGDDLRRSNVRTARVDFHVKVFLRIEAFVLSDIVPGKLGLGHPFELQRYAVRCRSNSPGKRERDARRSQCNSVHASSPDLFFKRHRQFLMAGCQKVTRIPTRATSP